LPIFNRPSKKTTEDTEYTEEKAKKRIKTPWYSDSVVKIFVFTLFSFVLFLISLSSCTALEKFEKRDLVIEGKEGKVTIKAEIALTDAQHEQGLMYRKAIKDGEGMLFVFQSDQILSFWMKNTLVALSIAYISYDGRILEIYDMQPGNLDPVKSSRSVRYALEVPQGWFSRAGLGVGDRLETQGL
jgi:uncharacterized membrane protein (UPF0127 family)